MYYHQVLAQRFEKFAPNRVQQVLARSIIVAIAVMQIKFILRCRKSN